MDEGIKRIFCKYFGRYEDKFKAARSDSTGKSIYACALNVITGLYADVCGISYDTAADELHGGVDDD